jgi:hypothetical protein
MHVHQSFVCWIFETRRATRADLLSISVHSYLDIVFGHRNRALDKGDGELNSVRTPRANGVGDFLTPLEKSRLRIPPAARALEPF